MVLGLYVVAGVMVAGGLLAIYSGSDIIVMERGWTMVISGSVMAAGGVLLAGIATVVARLQMLEGEFARIADRLARPEDPTFAIPPDLTPRPAQAPDRSNAPPPAVMLPIPDRRDLDIKPEPITAPPQEPQRAEAPATSAVDEGDALFDLSPPAAAASPSDDQTEAASAADASSETDEPPATVAGTYNSGGNFYIMYSDGSIEAETPAGKFRFTSLDELKDFIAAGGDRPKAAAPV